MDQMHRVDLQARRFLDTPTMSSFEHRVKGESKAFRSSNVKMDGINHDSGISDGLVLKKSWDDEQYKCYAIKILQSGAF